MGWREAITKVLQDNGHPTHYSEITQAIIDNKYRESVGATPAYTVAAVLSTSIKQFGDSSSFYKHSRGVYGLRTQPEALAVEPSEEEDEATADALEMGLINAFGMFWNRSEVFWKTNKPRLLGVQQYGSTPVDFTPQTGVYLLYDAHRVIYVGRARDQGIGSRLWDHTRDRLRGRWDRFSWFGIRGVDGGTGTLGEAPTDSIKLPTLIDTMEALLIEGLEPPQNRRRGDGFNAVEFMQVTDDQIIADRQKQLLNEMSKGLGS